MNEKNYFTIVVPLSPDAQKIVQGNPSAVPLRAAVWSQAAERMKPLLGGVCSRFSPAAAPYGEPLHLPFGVALGGAEAEQFLLCYFHARENQEEEIRSRTQAIRALGRKVGQFHPDEETTLTVMAFRSSDPELHKQMDVAQRFFSDDITAAAGLYYLGFGSNYCDEFVMRLSDGYQTVLGENGSTLSGGERQRISIARALLKDAPIILLDEATASLDPENEVLIQRAIARLVEGKTVIMIAHRLRTVVDADQIFVLENGKLVERGTHDELIAHKGLYEKLYHIQQESLDWVV